MSLKLVTNVCHPGAIVLIDSIELILNNSCFQDVRDSKYEVFFPELREDL